MTFLIPNTWTKLQKQFMNLALYLKHVQNDKTTLQLYRAVHDLQTTSNRKMIQSRGPMVYEKYLTTGVRSRLHFDIPQTDFELFETTIKQVRAMWSILLQLKDFEEN